MVWGKSLRDTSGPAEVPPSSYTASQYVDSTGCVFIRAGRNGISSWVPRVTRGGQLMCGYKPTQVSGTTAPSRRTRSAAYIEIRPGDDIDAALSGQPQPRTTASAPTAAPRRTTGMTFAEFLFGKPRTRTVAARPTVSAGPSPTVFSNPVTVAASQPTATTAAAPQGVNPWMRFDGRHAVRTGPQAAHPSGYGTTIAVAPAPVQGPAVAPQVVYLPPTVDGSNHPYWKSDGRHTVRYGPQAYHPSGAGIPARADTAAAVPQAPAAAYDMVQVPPGYRPIYPEGRLNPMRGVGSGQGEATMNLVWTQTVPRRLIDVGTGRDVTTTYPQMVYPYTNLALQQQHMGVRVSTRSQATRKRVAAAEVKPAPAAAVVTEEPVVVAEIDPGTVTDTAADAVAAAPMPAAGGLDRPFVQVATFGVPANARRTLARFTAAGLPVTSRPFSSGGRSYDIVLIGPFADAAALADGLARARAAGFSDAFAVR